MEPLELEEMPVQEIEEAPDQVSLKITTVFDCIGCWSDFVHSPLSSGDGVLPDPAVGAKTKG